MRALIIGITGQDGSYLAELLLEKGYDVSGMIRWSSHPRADRLANIRDQVTLYHGDITDAGSLSTIIRRSNPDEIYNLAAISSTHYEATNSLVQVTGVGPINLFEAVKNSGRDIKIFQASSSEMLALHEAPQDERTRFFPTNAYGAAKLMAHTMANVYRQQHGMYIACGVLFNHESPRRTEDFVSRKITASAARISKGLQKNLSLWDMCAMRDWGYAKEYVEAMWLMMQREKGGDYVIGTGVSHSVMDFVDLAFHYVGLEWKEHVSHPTYKPVTSTPKACIQKANIVLGWRPKVGLEELVGLMMDHDLELIEN